MKIAHIIFTEIKSRFESAEMRNPERLADMLRYDHAFQCDKYPGIVAFPRFRTPHGYLGGRITHARWDSFNVRIVKEFTPEWSVVPEEWFTYRQAIVGPGLIRLSLADHLAAKDFEALRKANRPAS